MAVKGRYLAFFLPVNLDGIDVIGPAEYSPSIVVLISTLPLPYPRLFLVQEGTAEDVRSLIGRDFGRPLLPCKQGTRNAQNQKRAQESEDGKRNGFHGVSS